MSDITQSISDSLSDLTGNINEEALTNFVSDYRKKAATKLSNPYIFGVLALWYAYKGKLGSIERAMIGVAGVITIYSNYKQLQADKANADVVSFIENYVKAAAPDLATQVNTISNSQTIPAGATAQAGSSAISGVNITRGPSSGVNITKGPINV